MGQLSATLNPIIRSGIAMVENSPFQSEPAKQI